MIDQLNIAGKTKIEVAIERFKTFEPANGYYVAFSGGKDSVVIKALADMAGVKYDAHYNVTSVDPPELIYFIREYHPDVEFEYPRDKDGNRITMWNLIPEKRMPPTRMVRYCCDKLKEGGGSGRFVVTGVRWAESARRNSSRHGLEVEVTRKGHTAADPDNPVNEKMVRHCPTRGKHILNPIVDWENDEVWEFIRKYDIPYCKLYDEGYTRLGCIGCPINSKAAAADLERYPKYKRAYIKAFERMIAARMAEGKDTQWKTGEDVMKWWLHK